MDYEVTVSGPHDHDGIVLVKGVERYEVIDSNNLYFYTAIDREYASHCFRHWLSFRRVDASDETTAMGLLGRLVEAHENEPDVRFAPVARAIADAAGAVGNGG